MPKKLVDHSSLQKKPWNFGLKEYRCTLLTGNIPSPLELLTDWKPRTSLPSILQRSSTTREHHEALIKKPQMDISEELSISTYEPGQTVGVSIYFTRYVSQLWFLSQHPNLIPTGVGWNIPNRNSEEHDFTSSHAWIQQCVRENRCFPAPRWKKTTPSNLHQQWMGMNPQFLQLHLFQMHHLKFLTDHQQLGKCNSFCSTLYTNGTSEKIHQKRSSKKRRISLRTFH